MSDIIVTTPKSEMGNSAREAAACIASGGGWYFRRVHTKPRIARGERVWYTESGYIRGYAVVSEVIDTSTPQGKAKLQEMGLEIIPKCEITGKNYGHGWYIFMRAESWKWIRPTKYAGFQGWRYFSAVSFFGVVLDGSIVCGSWLDPKPRVVA